MTDTSAADRLYVGIDVAADTFTAAWLAPGGTLTGDQSPAGYANLQRHLEASAGATGDILVVLAATGDHWVALAVALHEAGYRVGVVAPLAHQV
jgi:transposase